MGSNYRSKLSQEVEQWADQILSGHLLAIDPSSGSSGSMPGYALFKAGQLIDCGTIDLPPGNRALHNRLYLLRHTLQNSFEKPDILAVERIAPVMPSKNGAFLHKNASSLIKSVGAILSCWDVPTVEPAPMTWHSMTPPEYVKGDVADACMIGWSVLITLARVRGDVEPRPTFPPGVCRA